MIQYAAGTGEEEDLPVTATATWQRGRHLGIAKGVGAELVAAVWTVPFCPSCRHLRHADTLEVEPFFVALLDVSTCVLRDGRQLTLLSHEIIWP